MPKIEDFVGADVPDKVPSQEPTQEGSRATSVSGDASSPNIDALSQIPADLGSWKGWAELENDPVIFSTLLREWGVPNIKVNDLVELDSVFEYPLEDVYGLIFLSRWAAPEMENETTEAPTGVWFANQTLSNSCATVALMNIINNHATINLGEVLNDFRKNTIEMSPKERGLALDAFDFVRDVHNSFATEFDKMSVDLRLKQDAAWAERKKKAAVAAARRGRKKRKSAYEPADDDEGGLHFVAYVEANSAVWRMDGLERLPRRLVAVDEGGSWVATVLPELQAQLESAAVNDMEYSLLALTAMRDSWGVEADRVKMDRARENWGPFLSHMVKLHAHKGTLKQMILSKK